MLITLDIGTILGILTFIALIVEGLIRHLVIDAKKDKLIAILEMQIGPFWEIIKKNIPELLHSPTHVEKDDLLKKLATGEISLPDAIKLKEILGEELVQWKEAEKLDKVNGGIWVMMALNAEIVKLETTKKELERVTGKHKWGWK